MNHFDRAKILQKSADILLEKKEELGRVITDEMGKPITQAVGEVEYAAGFFTWFAEEAKRIYSLKMPSRDDVKRLYMSWEPVGHVAIITPWNFPLAMGARKIAPAFAAGCPVTVKPTPECPRSMEKLREVMLQAGLPEEYFTVRIGDEEAIGNEFVTDPKYKKLSFTGSTAVGKMLYEKAAKNFMKVTLELGGHAPFIVFEDADISRAAEEAVATKFRVSGQTCICANRFYIHEKVMDAFVEQFIHLTKKLKVGDPLDPTTDLSNRTHPSSQAKSRKHIEDALQKGATAHLKATEPYQPEILTGVTDEMLIFQEETFGPVAGISGFTDPEEAIEKANSTPWGLAAYAFTENLKMAHHVSQDLQFGLIGLNDGAPACVELPFGGVKDSGFGREGGPTGIYEYLIQKSLSLKL